MCISGHAFSRRRVSFLAIEAHRMLDDNIANDESGTVGTFDGVIAGLFSLLFH
jgi:hypothetical protein